MAGRKLHVWLGGCHVHAGIRSEDVTALMAANPGADLLLHPECGCISQCMFAVAEGELPADRTFILSTGGMAKHARECAAPVDLVGTEVGMLHRLHKEAPTKTFIPLKADAICEYMKTITLPKLYRALRDDVYEVNVPRAHRGSRPSRDRTHDGHRVDGAQECLGLSSLALDPAVVQNRIQSTGTG